MTRLAYAAAAAILALIAQSENASGAQVLSAATRGLTFTSTSTSAVAVPLRDNNTSVLHFATTAANQTVTIVYNAECVVAAPRGTWLSIRIAVDGVEANPSSGTDFALCSAVDVDGQTWASVARQSVLKVPLAGDHTVRVFGRLVSGSGTWRLDDSSLVVQKGLISTATREGSVQGTNTTETEFPLRDNGLTTIDFTTTAAFQRVRLTFNAECLIAGDFGMQRLDARIELIAGPGPVPYNNVFRTLCGPADTTGQTWSGTARQLLVMVATPGTYTARVVGKLNAGQGIWRVDDSSLVVDRSLLAMSIQEGEFQSSSTTEVAVPLGVNGATTVQFTTAEADRLARIVYVAKCQIAALRGRWVSIRVVVDGVEAQPAVAHNFAFCSSLTEPPPAPFHFNHAAGFRQSVINVPAGDHTVQIFARASGAATWILSQGSLTIE